MVTPEFSRNDRVTVVKPNTDLTGQSGRVFALRDEGKMVDVDFPVGGLFRIPAADIRKDEAQ